MNENEDKLRELLRQVQVQKEKKKTMEELADRRTRQMENENRELIEKIKDDEDKIREKMDIAAKLKADNDKAERVIRDLARQSDLNQLQL